MEDATIITLFALACLLVFTCVAVLMGYNSYLIWTVLFIFATSAGIALPQPGWLRRN